MPDGLPILNQNRLRRFMSDLKSVCRFIRHVPTLDHMYQSICNILARLILQVSLYRFVSLRADGTAGAVLKEQQGLTAGIRQRSLELLDRLYSHHVGHSAYPLL